MDFGVKFSLTYTHMVAKMVKWLEEGDNTDLIWWMNIFCIVRGYEENGGNWFVDNVTRKMEMIVTLYFDTNHG